MFDRGRSEGATEERRRGTGGWTDGWTDGGREGGIDVRDRGDNCTGGGRLRLGSLSLPPSVKQPERHVGMVVSSQAGDGGQDRSGHQHRQQGGREERRRG